MPRGGTELPFAGLVDDIYATEERRFDPCVLIFIAVAGFYSFAWWSGIGKAVGSGASVHLTPGDLALVVVIVVSLVAASLGRARRS